MEAQLLLCSDFPWDKTVYIGGSVHSQHVKREGNDRMWNILTFWEALEVQKDSIALGIPCNGQDSPGSSFHIQTVPSF